MSFDMYTSAKPSSHSRYNEHIYHFPKEIFAREEKKHGYHTVLETIKHEQQETITDAQWGDSYSSTLYLGYRAMGSREDRRTLGREGLDSHKNNGAPGGRIHCLFGGINILMWFQVTFPALVQTLICVVVLFAFFKKALLIWKASLSWFGGFKSHFLMRFSFHIVVSNKLGQRWMVKSAKVKLNCNFEWDHSQDGVLYSHLW